MQTKQSQREAFHEWWSRNTTFSESDIVDFWLQKQDQLLTELGKSIINEIPINRHCDNCNMFTALEIEDENGYWWPLKDTLKKKIDALINKYK